MGGWSWLSTVQCGKATVIKNVTPNLIPNYIIVDIFFISTVTGHMRKN